MASTLPSASIGSRTGKPTFSILTLDSSMPFSFTNAFHCAKAPSAAGAEHPAFEVLRLGDAGLGGGADGECRLVVHHQHSLDSLVRVLVPELDQRVDVEKADRIGAGGEAGDAGNGAGAGIDGDVETLGLVVAFVDRDEVGGRGALKLPVEGKLHIGLRANGAYRQRGRRRSCEHAEKLDPVHVRRSL